MNDKNNKIKQALGGIEIPADSKARILNGAKNGVSVKPRTHRSMRFAVMLAAIAVIVSLSVMIPLFTPGTNVGDVSYSEDSGFTASNGSDTPYTPSDDSTTQDSSEAPYTPSDDSTPSHNSGAESNGGVSDESYSVPPIDDYVMSADKLQMVSKFYEDLAAENPDVHPGFFELYDTFAIELFMRCAQSGEKNVMISPFSILTTLSMVMNGADGETKAAIEKQIGMTAEQLGRSIVAYANSFYRSQKCSVASACSMWIKNSFADNIRDSFYDKIEDIYDSEIMLAPFDDSTVKSINDWCEKNTNGMIKKIIDDMPDSTVMLLANALVFEADWQNVFEGDTFKRTFYGLRGETEVDMMSEDATLDLLQDETCIGFLKKYDGGRYAFAALIPNDENEDIYSFAASLGAGRWRYLFDTSFSAYTRIYLPCFTADYTDANMADKIADIGYSALLDKNADFAGILKAPVDGRFYVSDISHAVHIEVTRFGTRAAGVTAGRFSIDSMPGYYVELNRPFVYAIVDMRTGSMLFVGVITDI